MAFYLQFTYFNKVVGIVGSASFVGMMIGALLWALAADYIGRRICFMGIFFC